MRIVSGCTLCTLYFVNSGEVVSDEMLLITLLLMTCLQERFLQTRFFRRSSSDAFFQTLLASIKFVLLFDLFIQNLYE